MALAATTLASAKGTNETVIKLTSATGAAKKMIALVDGEQMLITSIGLTPTLGVVPGYAGTTAGPHAVLAPVIYGIPSDFSTISGPSSNSYGADGAIAVPVVDDTIFLTKATAGAYTLAGPAADSQVTVKFISTTAAAHTITYTAGFYGDTTSSDVATFPAKIGAMFTIRAQGGVWMAQATADDGVLIA